jgi:hypothetical protein
MRKDPNSNFVYMAYSWAHTLADGTHVVDLHLASSANLGATWTYAGPLYQSNSVTQTAPVNSSYATTNDTSTETVDFIPIPLTGNNAGQTLWVEAHQSYLVAPQGGIYDQLIPTNEIVVTALQLASPTSANAPTTMLGLGSTNTQEARLGANGTVANRNPTQSLSALAGTAGANCSNWGQPALWYQSPYLYLAVECTEYTGSLDLNELGHFLYVTTPTGTNPAAWTWSYVGIFATEPQAQALGNTAAEATTYKFFTEPEFVQTKSGQLAVIMTPGIFSTMQQPVTQYGCRIVPILSLSPTGITLDIDATTNAPVVIAKVTENDLYTGVNQGPGACTYEPAATTGIVVARKFENDPTYGFYLYPVSSTILP